MSKAEKFIQDYTRNCSNVVAYSGMTEGSELRYHEWLTPDQARRACEIAREEVIREIEKIIDENEDGCLALEIIQLRLPELKEGE